MPTYQYACTACEDRLEVVQKFSDDPLTECPSCHGRLRKVFSSVGIVFKGSGFYRTDSRSSATGGNAPPREKKDKDKESTDAKPSKEPAASSDSAKSKDSTGKSSPKSSGQSSSSGGSKEKVA